MKSVSSFKHSKYPQNWNCLESKSPHPEDNSMYSFLWSFKLLSLILWKYSWDYMYILQARFFSQGISTVLWRVIQNVWIPFLQPSARCELLALDIYSFIDLHTVCLWMGLYIAALSIVLTFLKTGHRADLFVYALKILLRNKIWIIYKCNWCDTF